MKITVNRRDRRTAFRAAALSVLCYFHSSLTCFVFIFCLLMFPFCRMHQACRQKAHIDPHQKKHKPNHQSHGFFLLLFFTVYHVLFVGWGQSLPCAANFPEQTHIFLLQCCTAPPHLLYCCQYTTILRKFQRNEVILCLSWSFSPPAAPTAALSRK